MVADPQLVIQYSLRRRLDDVFGLGFLALATILSFTGLVELARYMHPVRFALLLSTAVCFYWVATRTFVRLEFADDGIESHSLLRKAKHWQYDQLTEVHRTDALINPFGKCQSLQLRFSDGSTLSVDCGMLNGAELIEFLRQHRRLTAVVRGLI